MMNLATALLFLSASPASAEPVAATVQEGSTQFSFEAGTTYLPGRPFPVTIEIVAGATQAPVAAWLLKESAFLVNGESVGARTSDQFLSLPAGSDLKLEFDLAPFIDVKGDFDLAYGNVGGAEPIRVSFLEPAPSDLNYMEIDESELGKYMIAVDTNRGRMLWEMWPDVAPGHVRNFLDLSASGFYDDVLFHRVIPGFMIQGGDPNTKNPSQPERWGSGDGPRLLEAEFSDRPHVRGTLSTARKGGDDNSASCQFFVVHARAPHLDREYTVFGQLLPDSTESLRTLDAIASTALTSVAPGAPASTPVEPQRILGATIVLHPNPPMEKGEGEMMKDEMKKEMEGEMKKEEMGGHQ